MRHAGVRYVENSTACALNVLYFMHMKKKTSISKPAKPYKIDQGVKIPEPVVRSGNGQASRAIATANLMKVGDSFLVKDGLEALQTSKKLRDLMHRTRQNGGTKTFTQRTVKGGTRFWRTK